MMYNNRTSEYKSDALPFMIFYVHFHVFYMYGCLSERRNVPCKNYKREDSTRLLSEMFAQENYLFLSNEAPSREVSRFADAFPETISFPELNVAVPR